MDTKKPLTTTTLAERLAVKAEAASHKQAPPPSPHKVIGVLDEDKDDINIIINKAALLEALGPGNSTYRTQEGANLAVDGSFTFTAEGKTYRFHLRLFPAWMRVDMVVGK